MVWRVFEGAALAIALILCVAQSAYADESAQPAPASQRADCAPPARYVMPEGVEADVSPRDVAPADLPGSRSPYKAPGEIVIELGTNPLEPDYNQSYLPLGEAVIDRKTGQLTIDGAPVGNNLGGCVETSPHADGRTKRKSQGRVSQMPPHTP